jgi:DNA-binding CsgD family transcriptional regulator
MLSTLLESETSLQDFASELGYDYFSYIVSSPPRGRTGHEGMLLTSYPAEWSTRYRRRGYHQDDPVVVTGRRARLPFAWGSDRYLKDLDPSRRRMFLEARDFGIQEGITIPVYGPSGDCSLFTVARGKTLAAPLDPSQNSYLCLVTMAQHLHAYTMDRYFPEASAQEATLTDHERVCLLWTLEGKTAWEISQIVGRSKPTIEYHLQKAMRKLGASNKTHAASRALRLGLI